MGKIEPLSEEEIEALRPWYFKTDRLDLPNDLTRRLLATLDARTAERDELQAIFDLRWKADRRAIKKWQAATGEALTWPDHADLCVWLLEQLAKAEEEMETMHVAFDGLTEEPDNAHPETD